MSECKHNRTWLWDEFGGHRCSNCGEKSISIVAEQQAELEKFKRLGRECADQLTEVRSELAALILKRRATTGEQPQGPEQGEG